MWTRLLDELARLWGWRGAVSGAYLWQTVRDNPDVYGAEDLDAPYEWEEDELIRGRVWEQGDVDMWGGYDEPSGVGDIDSEWPGD